MFKQIVGGRTWTLHLCLVLFLELFSAKLPKRCFTFAVTINHLIHFSGNNNTAHPFSTTKITISKIDNDCHITKLRRKLQFLSLAKPSFLQHSLLIISITAEPCFHHLSLSAPSCNSECCSFTLWLNVVAAWLEHQFSLFSLPLDNFI